MAIKKTAIQNDTGSHYRFEYKGNKIDPARVQLIFDATHPMQGAILKKTLLAGKRGKKNIIEDINDIITAAQRWKEIIEEDSK